MQITANNDYVPRQVGKAKAMEKHAEHEPDVQHSNESIYAPDRGLNASAKGDLDKTLTRRYQKMIDERNARVQKLVDAKKISKPEGERRKQTVKSYLDGAKPKQCVTTLVSTLGNKQTTEQLIKQLGYQTKTVKLKSGDEKQVLTNSEQRKHWREFWNNTFFNTVKDCYGKNSGFIVTAFQTNLDEFTPHAHVQLVNAGKTAGGKISYSFNAALNSFLKKNGEAPLKDNRKRMSKTREITDSILIENANKQAKLMAAKGCPEFADLHFELKRTGGKHGLSMAEFKRQKVEEDINKLNEQVKQQQQRAEQAEQRVALMQKAFKDKQDELDKLKANEKETQRLKQFRQRLQEEGYVNEEDYMNKQNQTLNELKFWKQAASDFFDLSEVYKATLNGTRGTARRFVDVFHDVGQMGQQVAKTAHMALKKAQATFKSKFGGSPFSFTGSDEMVEQRKHDESKLMASKQNLADIRQQTFKQSQSKPSKADMTLDQMQELLNELQAEGAGNNYKAPDYDKARRNSPAYKRAELAKKKKAEQVRKQAETNLPPVKATWQQQKQDDGPEL